MDSYDAIVVGAGPAGSAAAYTIAQKGLSVVLLERGQTPGCKNLFGGTIYREPTAEVFPAFWEEAPLERVVTSERVWFLDTESAVQLGYSDLRYGRTPYNQFTAFRSHFDKWLAEQAAHAGAHVRSGAHARELLYEKGLFTQGPICGVRLDTGEELYAKVVVITEGVNPFLTSKAGLLKRHLPAYAFNLYVREVLALPAEKINERFQLEEGEGAIIGLIGFPTATGFGKGGIWTCKDSLSIILGGPLDQYPLHGQSPYTLLQRLKAHPLLKPLLAGAETVEYQAKLIPKGGYSFIPRLYGDHVLVAGDAAAMTSGRRGVDFALLTGKYAGETVAQAQGKRDFTAKTLASYEAKLQQTFLMEDIEQGRNGIFYRRTHPDADYLLSRTLNQIGREFFTVKMASKREKKAQIIKILKSQQKPLKTLKDLWAGFYDWRFF